MASIDSLKRAEAALRKFAMSLPDVHEDFPWGESAFKVNRKKVFLFMRLHEEGLSLSTKLPQSREAALNMPFTEPTHYGLGKSGWVTSKFEIGDRPSIDTLQKWVTESYRAVAPKKLAVKLQVIER